MPRFAVIEDKQVVNDRLKSLLLTIPGAEVEQAFGLLEGQELLKKKLFDVVVLDIELGDGPKEKYGGLSILADLTGKRITTIVVSGMPEENLPELAISLKAYDFIAKPINELDFINKVEHALEWASDAEREGDSATDRTWPPNLEPDPSRYFGLRWKSKPVRLTLTQLRLVHCLAAQPGQPVEYEKLAKQLDSTSSHRAIATHLSEARQRFLLIDPKFDAIDSEPGKGYVWKTSG